MADLSFLGDSDWYRIKKLKCKALCTLFRRLVMQLPAKAVLLCAIDELSLYETATLAEQTGTIARRLTRVVNMQDDVVMKLLVTCRGRALETSQYFKGYILDLDELVEPTDSSAWTISTIALD